MLLGDRILDQEASLCRVSGCLTTTGSELLGMFLTLHIIVTKESYGDIDHLL